MRAILFALLGVLASTSLAAAEMIKLESKFDVKTTADNLEAAVKANADGGARVFARFDHAAEAASVGKDLPPTTVVVFGNPNGGTPLMTMNREMALDLPLRVLIWEQDGKTWVAYHNPEAVATSHGIDPMVKPVQGAKKALAGLTAKAAGK